jgi:hypothetical protein
MLCIASSARFAKECIASRFRVLDGGCGLKLLLNQQRFVWSKSAGSASNNAAPAPSRRWLNKVYRGETEPQQIQPNAYA